ncbi:CHD3-type chromatin-remodeling factor PICKLE [Acorus gramineus]|uniref:CHD3-type chromatin-remodeling factor PICKLE n=1 Tax=Acorus gramineus TaxID=55184 RepID=A0AAV9BF11_ACOGR|nr:CHD3-type chromatin-remodeling factor PICKLE [Acorus gramineus]
MSSLVERLRVRSERKPYSEPDSDDEDVFAVRRGGASKAATAAAAATEQKIEPIVRADAKEDSCQECGESEDLLSCGTCNYSYHAKCLLAPKLARPGSWSCPECVSPLNEIDKILDSEMRLIETDESDASKMDSKQKSVKQYLVKWKGLSYLHCTWVPEKEFLKAFKTNPRLRTRVNTFHRQMDSMINDEDWVAIRPEWTTVDRVISSRKSSEGREYLIKWKELPYDESSWEAESDISAFQDQIERFKKIQSRARKPSIKSKNQDAKESNTSKNQDAKESSKSKNQDSKVSSKSKNQDAKESKNKLKEFQHYEHSPEFLSGGSLHPYQLEGLNFLRYSWSKNTHVILADEMGLGKTIQSIAFLASLLEENVFPHLVIAPLSTLRNWEREFATWAPQMNVVMYVGSSQARATIRQHEFYYPKLKTKHLKKKKVPLDGKEKMQERIKFHVLLTSYEMINMDSTSLKPIKWKCMIVDEGHRLKNKDSKLFISLKLYSSKHRVLLTGTPLQNNLDELFMLMHFLDAGKFASLEDFQEEFKDINQEEQIIRLHKMLAPHLLRRVKKDVMKDLPPKKELILRVDLSSKQKEYYKAILTRNYQILARRGGAQISLINVVMELRKLCCHAYMLEGVEPEKEPADSNEALRQLLEASGKMQLLDKMMVKLKEEGHRVLIYSQFQHMLDLLEDYLGYKKWIYERIDGKISGAERQIRIDRFNAKNSTRFCFLLSTRAGGLGINLATADTVIIYDSDWNPHADLQAMARAHRLGQTNKVMIYRLITRGTIEERMMQMTKKKMILEHLVVGRLKTQTVNQEELDDIIRYGSKELFSEENDEARKARQIHYDAAAIDRLLDREQISEESQNEDVEDDGFLKAFKVANFEFIEEVEAAAAEEEEPGKQSSMNQSSGNNVERASYWDELLRDRYEVHQVEEFTSLGKGKRSRKQMAAAEDDDLAGLEDVSSEDADDNYHYDDDSSDTEKSSSGNVLGRRGQVSKKRARAGYSEPLPLMEGEGKSFRVLGFNQNQRAVFVQILMRYGLGDYDWREFTPRLKQKSLREVKEYGTLFLSHIVEDITSSPSFSDGVPKEGLRVHDVLVRIAILQLIRDKVKRQLENPGAPLFTKDILSRMPVMNWRIWKEELDFLLLKAIIKHGYGRWQTMLDDKSLGFMEIICQELNLSFTNGSAIGSTQMHETTCGPSVNGGLSQGASVGTGSGFSDATSQSAEATQGIQLGSDVSIFYQSREAQRRMAEFLKKRFCILEKAINAEYQKEYFGEFQTCEPMSEDPEIGPPGSDSPASNSMVIDPQINNQSETLELIASEVLEAAQENKLQRLEMARLYNAMCKVVEETLQDSVPACGGETSAALEVICKDVQQVLGGDDSVPLEPEVHNNVAEADVPPSKDDEDIIPGEAVPPEDVVMQTETNATEEVVVEVETRSTGDVEMAASSDKSDGDADLVMTEGSKNEPNVSDQPSTKAPFVADD